MDASTLPDFDYLVALVIEKSLVQNPLLISLSISDDGSFPRWATDQSRRQLYLLLTAIDRDIHPLSCRIIDDFLAGSIGLAEAIQRWRLLSLPPKLMQFAVSWQAKLEIYWLSRAKLISVPSPR